LTGSLDIDSAFVQCTAELRFAGWTLEDLGIESEFEVDCLRRVVDGVPTFGVPFERAAFLGRALYPANARVRPPGVE
jgi:hypothetical protein